MQRRCTGDATRSDHPANPDRLGRCGMDVVDTWTGRRASALRAALRMTNDSFAEHLGIAVRTVANWEAKPDLVLSSTMQQALDTVLSQASGETKQRFGLLLKERSDEPGPSLGDSKALKVAIAVVLNGPMVLLVRRRQSFGELSWQFPAGVVKPGQVSTEIAVEETFAETAVHCTVRRMIGGRIHPITGVYCEYFQCDYLTGTPENKDMVENWAALWVKRAEITRYVPEGQLYAPVRELLEAASDAGEP